MLWVIARNGRNRPTLQHATDPSERDVLICDPNLIIDGWSRSYSSQPIPAIACKKCVKATALVLPNPTQPRQLPYLVSLTGT